LIVNIVLIILFSLALAYIIYSEKFKKNKGKPICYHIKVKLSNGSHKLVLNEEQYQQFKSWVVNAEGLYEITDDNNYIALNRNHMASVEVKKR
jgi:hypothetical protein